MLGSTTDYFSMFSAPAAGGKAVNVEDSIAEMISSPSTKDKKKRSSSTSALPDSPTTLQPPSQLKRKSSPPSSSPGSSSSKSVVTTASSTTVKASNSKKVGPLGVAPWPRRKSWSPSLGKSRKSDSSKSWNPNVLKNKYNRSDSLEELSVIDELKSVRGDVPDKLIDSVQAAMRVINALEEESQKLNTGEKGQSTEQLQHNLSASVDIIKRLKEENEALAKEKDNAFSILKEVRTEVGKTMKNQAKQRNKAERKEYQREKKALEDKMKHQEELLMEVNRRMEEARQHANLKIEYEKLMSQLGSAQAKAKETEEKLESVQRDVQEDKRTGDSKSKAGQQKTASLNVQLFSLAEEKEAANERVVQCEQLLAEVYQGLEDAKLRLAEGDEEKRRLVEEKEAAIEEEKAKLKREKEEELARLKREKEDETYRWRKAKEEKEEEAARLKKEKKEKEEEAARLKQEKEAAEMAAKEMAEAMRMANAEANKKLAWEIATKNKLEKEKQQAAEEAARLKEYHKKLEVEKEIAEAKVRSSERLLGDLRKEVSKNNYVEKMAAEEKKELKRQVKELKAEKELAKATAKKCDKLLDETVVQEIKNTISDGGSDTAAVPERSGEELARELSQLRKEKQAALDRVSECEILLADVFNGVEHMRQDQRIRKTIERNRKTRRSPAAAPTTLPTVHSGRTASAEEEESSSSDSSSDDSSSESDSESNSGAAEEGTDTDTLGSILETHGVPNEVPGPMSLKNRGRTMSANPFKRSFSTMKWQKKNKVGTDNPRLAAARMNKKMTTKKKKKKKSSKDSKVSDDTVAKAVAMHQERQKEQKIGQIERKNSRSSMGSRSSKNNMSRKTKVTTKKQTDLGSVSATPTRSPPSLRDISDTISVASGDTASLMDYLFKAATKSLDEEDAKVHYNAHAMENENKITTKRSIDTDKVVQNHGKAGSSCSDNKKSLIDYFFATREAENKKRKGTTNNMDTSLNNSIQDTFSGGSTATGGTVSFIDNFLPKCETLLSCV